MKKTLKWVALTAGGLLLVLIIGLAALPFVFPLDKIKDFATAKLSETLHRKVVIKSVSFDIFSGIKLQGIEVGDLVRAESLDLRYAFWPLFSRQIIVSELSLVRPELKIVKERNGLFNFSDLLQTKAPPNQPASKPPFDLFITSFSVKDGRIVYSDRSAGTTNELRQLNIKVSGFELALVKPIDLSLSVNATYGGKVIPLALSGQVGVNLVNESVKVSGLNLTIAGESLHASATVSGWKVAPQVNFTLSSKGINLDPLLAIFAVPTTVKKAPAKPGEMTKMINSLTNSVPRNLGIKGEVDVANLTVQKFKVDRAKLSLALSGKNLQLGLDQVNIYDGILAGRATVDLNAPGLSYSVSNLKLTGFNSTPFLNALVETFLTKMPDYREMTNKVYGQLDASAALTGRGVEPDAILANLSGQAAVEIKNGELKRVKTLAEAGKLLKSNTLQGDIKFGELSSSFGLKNKVVSVSSFRLAQNDFKVNYKGGIDLNRLAWVAGNRLTLKLAPALTTNLPKEFSIFKDDKGWLETTFELTGTLSKPIPKPILEKPLDVAVGKIKAKIEAKKIEIETKVQAELASKEAEAKKALEQEKQKAVEAVKQEAKQQLKNLFKP
ncbi:MAG: AsmA family protein [Candidatus Margulisiibacteriota bacterium]